MLDMNNHSTNAGYGSNLSSCGAIAFHESHKALQSNIIRKKPIVPTCLVIHNANFCKLVRFYSCSTLMFRMGFRSRFKSFKLGIFGLSICMVMEEPYLGLSSFSVRINS